MSLIVLRRSKVRAARIRVLAIDFDDTLFTLPVSWRLLMAEYFVEQVYGPSTGTGDSRRGRLIEVYCRRIAAASGTPLSVFMLQLRDEVVAVGRRTQSVEHYRDEFDARWRETSDALHTLDTVTPGMPALLMAATDAGLPVAVVSGGDRDHKVQILKRLGLDDVIPPSAVFGDGDPRIPGIFSKRAALDWLHTRWAIEEVRDADDDSLLVAFVGDGTYDMLAARAAGALAVGFGHRRYADVYVAGGTIPAEPLASLLFDDHSPLRRCPLTPTLSSAVKLGLQQERIYWDEDLIEDRGLNAHPISVVVRYVPTFAERQLYYDQPPVSAAEAAACRMCDVVQSTHMHVRVDPTGHGQSQPWREFDEQFALVPNNFPYLRLQALITMKRHARLPSVRELSALMAMFANSLLRSVLVQIRGSGATVPEHAHMNMSAERLPLFALARARWLEAPGVRVDRVVHYPGAAYVVTASDVPLLARVCHELMEGILRNDRSFNLFLDEEGSAHLVLRDRERSTRLGRNMGAVEVAGMYLGNARGCDAKALEALRHVIRQRCDALTAQDFTAALAEVVTPLADGDGILAAVWNDMLPSLGLERA